MIESKGTLNVSHVNSSYISVTRQKMKARMLAWLQWREFTVWVHISILIPPRTNTNIGRWVNFGAPNTFNMIAKVWHINMYVFNTSETFKSDIIEKNKHLLFWLQRNKAGRHFQTACTHCIHQSYVIINLHLNEWLFLFPLEGKLQQGWVIDIQPQPP